MLDDDKQKEEVEDTGVKEEAEQDYNEQDKLEETIKARSQTEKKRSWFLPVILGIIIGALIVMIVYPELVDKTPTEETKEETVTTNKSVKVDVSTQITDAVEKVSPAVVGVTNVQQRTNFWDQQTEEADEAGTGSGVIYKKTKDKAYIVTNHHVIEGADILEIVLSDETKVEARLLGSDMFTDLAVLEIDAKHVDKTVEIGTSENIKVGEPAIAIGNPLGHMFAGSVTQGIISGKQRTIPQDFNQDGRADWQAEVLQTDAAINPGNSGGALINIEGQLIGINSMKISQTVAEGIGFAIPIDTALPIIEELEEKGEVTRPYLGVELYSLDDVPKVEWQNTLKLPEDIKGGVYIWTLEPLSPADRAGLKRLDVITELDGKPIKNVLELRKILYEEKKVNDELDITAYRDGKKIETTAKLVPQGKAN